MIRLVMLVLGVEVLRKRYTAFITLGALWCIAGIALFVDALDGHLSLPLPVFAWLLMIDGVAAVLLAASGVGGQRILRLGRGVFAIVAAGLIFEGENGNAVLSAILGTVFLADGALQCTSAWVVRYRRWKKAFAWGVLQILFAIFLYQPYPSHYVGTVAYALGFALIFIGGKTFLIGARVHHLVRNPGFADTSKTSVLPPTMPDEIAAVPVTTATSTPSPRSISMGRREFDGPPASDEKALTVHIWTPSGSSKSDARSRPLIDRYIAAVDRNGVISTGHAALEAPDGIYISLYPAVEIDRSPDDFARLLRAGPENDVPGTFQPDYAFESKAWCASTVRIGIRNYDAERLAAFWSNYRATPVYNLTSRNCSSTVALALEVALEGAIDRLHDGRAGWLAIARMFFTPELWVAAQLRKRGRTMAWTPGLVMDYARALSMVVDPRPYGLVKAWRDARRRLSGRGL